MKRFFLGLIFVSALIGCGKGSSQEAKELLQRILALVGIPQNIVVNVCQDNNTNNFCEESEIIAKISIDKGDTIEAIWQKVFEESNTYWLDQIDPNKKLLLVMQDSDHVRYDDGKFVLPFSINPNREANATKELSILEAMVDANYLNSSEVIAVKEMNFVERFYDALLKDLMRNFNTLKDKALDSSQSILANMKFMAEELRRKGLTDKLPQSINACGSDEACVDKIIDEVFQDLEISQSEAEAIAQKEQNSDEESQQSNNSDNSFLFLSKETRTFTDSVEGEDDTIIYNYDNKHRFANDNECTFSYDNQNRITESFCDNTNKMVYSYNQYGLSEVTGYESDKLIIQYKILEWSGDKPIKGELRSENEEEWTTIIWKTTYTGDNPTHIEASNNSGTSWSIEQQFDNKNNPYNAFSSIFGGYYPFGNEFSFWGVGYSKNNIIRQEWSASIESDGERYDMQYSYQFDITYNSSNYPTMIKTYISSEGIDRREQSTHTYEY